MQASSTPNGDPPALREQELRVVELVARLDALPEDDRKGREELEREIAGAYEIVLRGGGRFAHNATGQMEPPPEQEAGSKPVHDPGFQGRLLGAPRGLLGFVSFSFMLWVGMLVSAVRKRIVGSRRNLADSVNPDTLSLPERDRAAAASTALFEAWDAEVARATQEKRRPSTKRALFAAFGWEYVLIGGTWKIMWDITTWLAAYWLLLREVELTEDQAKPGGANVTTWYIIGGGMGLAALVSSFCIHQMFAACHRFGTRVRAAVTSLVYHKALRLRSAGAIVGEIVNLSSQGSAQLANVCLHLHFLWSAPLEILAILIIAGVEIELAALAAMGVMLLLTPVQIYLGALIAKTADKLSATETEYSHLMSEVLTVVKLIKLYAWEDHFSERLAEIRAKHMRHVVRLFLLTSANFASVFATPVLVNFVSLLTYQAILDSYDPPKPLLASTTFAVVSVFNSLRYPLLMLPSAVKAASAALTVVRRLDTFMTLPEVVGIPSSASNLAANNNNAGHNRASDPSASAGIAAQAPAAAAAAAVPVPTSASTPSTASTVSGEDGVAVRMTNAVYRWSEDSKPVLSGINAVVPRGQLVAVVGSVGSGKSSFLLGILRQLIQTDGETEVHGRVSYAPQEAWLLNDTVRNNVLFGEDMDRERYDHVIDICGLESDLKLLGGDEFMVGERGGNLSGGQKQRISLARAVYRRAQIYLLDDPLSAVDQRVGRHIFDNCFKQHLLKFEGATVILVTHQLHLLAQCGNVIALEAGSLVFQGRYEELAESKLSLVQFLSDEEEHAVMEEADEGVAKDKGQGEDEDDDAGRREQRLLSVSEPNARETVQLRNIRHSIERSTRLRHGTVTGKEVQNTELTLFTGTDAEQPEETITSDVLATTYVKVPTMNDTYARYAAASSGTFVFILLIIAFFAVHGIRITSDFWLRFYITDELGQSNGFYLGVYGGLTAAFFFGVLGRGIFLTYVSAGKSRVLHDTLKNALIHAPMGFFDVTPLGRVLAATTKHLFTVDQYLSNSLLQGLQYLPLALGAMLVVAGVQRWMWAGMLGLIAWTVLVAWFSAPAERVFKQLEASTRPVVASHTAVSLEGLFCLRAFGAEKRFHEILLAKVDTNSKCLYSLLMVRVFTALWVDIGVSIFIFLASLMVVVDRDYIKPGDVGLSLSNALQLLIFLQWTVRDLGDVHSYMVSTQQLLVYSSVTSEAPPIVKNKRPPKDWPPKGEIELRDVWIRYQRFTPSALKGVNLSIRPGTKVGIVGRTGSGKSSLFVALMRIREPLKGTLFVDGLDLCQMGLQDLRSNIAIIPQEPIMFTGTVRSNIDPSGTHSDEELWSALRSVELEPTIRALPGQLSFEVLDHGESFSLGQRQLFNVTRAILSQSKVVLLDEATAAMDMRTDALVQEIVRRVFHDRTVLTIAHRLSTVADYDRILFMSKGRNIEYSHPATLLNDPQSEFHGMVTQAGPATFARIKNISEEALKKREKLQRKSSASGRAHDLSEAASTYFSGPLQGLFHPPETVEERKESNGDAEPDPEGLHSASASAKSTEPIAEEHLSS